MKPNKSLWIPEQYVDELTPPRRPTPNDWLARLDDGSPALDGPGWSVDEEQELLKNGEIVEFVRCDEYGETALNFNADGFTAGISMPPEAQLCCVAEWGISGATIDEAVGVLREAGVDPDKYTLTFYSYLYGFQMRYVAERHSFEPAGPS